MNVTVNYKGGRQKKAELLAQFLNEKYGEINFDLGDPFKILVRTIISQQNRDELTDVSFRQMIKKFKSPKDFAEANTKEIAGTIKPSGLYNQKSKMIRQTARLIVEKYGGKVPDSREELMKLPGIGGKTADIILAYGFGEDVIACDTHVIWISNAIGLVESKKPEVVREALMSLVPKSSRRMFNIRAVEFGKRICNTGRPKCYMCPLTKMCNYYNLVYSKQKHDSIKMKD